MEPWGEDVDFSNWNIIYPIYLDKNATISNGRRVRRDIAVANPTLEDISIVCRHLKIPHVLEKEKRYPRNWLVPGRVRVKLFEDDPSKKLHSKKGILREIATLIPKIKNSQKSTSQPAASKAKSGKKKR